MTPFFRNIYRWKWASCSHWMTPIFTSKRPPRDMYPIFVWPPKSPLFFFKLKSSLKDPFFFYSPHQMTPYFSFVLTERPLFSLFSLSPKGPYFGGRVRTYPSLPYVSAPPFLTCPCLKIYIFRIAHTTFLDFQLIQISLPNFAFLFVFSQNRGLAISVQRSVSQERDFEKSKNPSAFLRKTIGSNNFVTPTEKKIQGFKLAKFEFKGGLWTICTQL